MKELAERIFTFVEKYAVISPNWDDENGEDKFTSPDVYQMLSCANELQRGNKPSRCFSEWGSGGYKPYTSKEGREEHDYLVKEIYKIINN